MLRSCRWNGLCLILMVLGTIGCSQNTDPAYIAEVDSWHAERVARLRSDTGWLTLVGLHPLGPGGNSLGAAEGHDVVLHMAAPAKLGTLTLMGEKVEFQPASGVQVHFLKDGVAEAVPFTGGVIRSDGRGTPDFLTVDSLIFYVIQRGEKFFLRVKDRQSNVLREFQGINRYPVANTWRVTAKLEGEPGTIPVANVLGQVANEPTPGTLVFKLAGETYRLQPTGAPGEGLFVVFGDASNGHGTYPGGRFLATEPPDDDGRVVLDFNRAYNPPCVFTAYATCPLPGPENLLPVAVEAGEKMWGTGH